MACHGAVIPLCVCVSVCLSVSACLCEQEAQHCVCASLCLFVIPLRFACITVVRLTHTPYRCLSLSFFVHFFFFFSVSVSPGRLVRAKRMVVAANPTEVDYTDSSIPIEWDGKSGSHCSIL